MARLLPLSFLSLFLVALLGLSACQKEQPSPEATAESLLVGRWALVEFSGGLDGKTIPADPTQKREVMFTNTGQAIGFLNGAPTGSAPYSLYQADAITGLNKTFLSCNGLPGFVAGGPVEVSAFDLFLSDNYYDGFTAHYVRR